MSLTYGAALDALKEVEKELWGAVETAKRSRLNLDAKQAQIDLKARHARAVQLAIRLIYDKI